MGQHKLGGWLACTKASVLGNTAASHSAAHFKLTRAPISETTRLVHVVAHRTEANQVQPGYLLLIDAHSHIATLPDGWLKSSDAKTI